MRTYTVIEREGELLGDVDWSYNFLSHFDCCATNDEEKKKRCNENVNMLRKLCDGTKWEATTYGGWPRCGWGEVLAVGMYDGWPYWKPVPSVLIHLWHGNEWHSFDSITSIRPKVEGVIK